MSVDLLAASSIVQAFVFMPRRPDPRGRSLAKESRTPDARKKIKAQKQYHIGRVDDRLRHELECELERRIGDDRLHAMRHGRTQITGNEIGSAEGPLETSRSKYRHSVGTYTRRPASRAGDGETQSTAAETKSRSRCRPAWARSRPKSRPVIWRFRVGSSICAAMAVALPRPALCRLRPDRRAGPSSLRSASRRPNSRSQCIW